MSFDPSLSNSLAELAARIRSEHEAVSDALKESVKHAIRAGELLIEAKEALQHGQWLPWLKDHCTISERTAQLYMRVARNRTEIEGQMRNGVADLSLNEVAALLMLSSDVRKLLSFARTAEGLEGEALVEFCIENGVGVIVTPNYDVFARQSEAEKIEWLVFMLFLTLDAKRGQFSPNNAWHHVEWLLRRPFQNVDEWLGPEGDKFRGVWKTHRVSDEFKTDWAAFRDEHQGLDLSDIEAKLEALPAAR